MRERRMAHWATLESRMTSQARSASVLFVLLAGCATAPREPAKTTPAVPPPETAAAKTAPKTPAPAARLTPQPKTAATATPAAAKPKAPPLDLASLQHRLTGTPAIRVLPPLTPPN